jgi:integrase
LSDTALEVLKALAPMARPDGYLFPGSKLGKPLSNMAMLTLLSRMDRDGLTVHGFRSTFRDWAAERTNYPREVAEAALAHTIEDKTEAAYRRGDLFEKRTKLMDLWAAFATMPAPTDSANDVAMRQVPNNLVQLILFANRVARYCPTQK